MIKEFNPKDFLCIKVFNESEDLAIKGGCKQKKIQKVKVKGDTTVIKLQVKEKGCGCEL